MEPRNTKETAALRGIPLGLLPDELDPWSKASLACLEEVVRSPEAFARAIELRPHDARLWVARGRALARRKQWGPAR